MLQIQSKKPLHPRLRSFPRPSKPESQKHPGSQSPKFNPPNATETSSETNELFLFTGKTLALLDTLAPGGSAESLEVFFGMNQALSRMTNPRIRIRVELLLLLSTDNLRPNTDALVQTLGYRRLQFGCIVSWCFWSFLSKM